MTFVGAWSEGGIPFLAGDMLVSGWDDSGQPHAHLATRDKLFPRELCWRVSGTYQKIYKISDNLVVGWSGTLISARVALRELLHRFEGREATFEELQLTLEEMRLLPECILVGWLVAGPQPTCFRWSSDVPSVIEVGDGFFEGSGVDYIRQTYLPGGMMAGKPEPIGSALAKVSQLLGEEVGFGENLTHAFGGGYQLLYWEDGRFVMLPSVTYLFLQVVKNGPSVEVSIHERLLKYYFQNGMVVLIPGVTRSGSRTIQEVYFVGSILGDPPNAYQLDTIPSLKSSYYSVFMNVVILGEKGLSCSFCIPDDKKDWALRVVDNVDGTEDIALSHDFLERIARSLLDLSVQ